MSLTLYHIALKVYDLLIRLSAPFNTKAAAFVRGRESIFETISEKTAKNTAPVAWFHCASLGEFEQGRPVLEAFRQQYPNYKIALTFFSPSGYEIRKNYSGADYIFYLPLDSASNAKRFLDLVKPRLAIFIKYEFWYHYLSELHARNIPVFSVSAIFRENQLFFKPYGGFQRSILQQFTHIFTQNQHSLELLKGIGITNASVAGDTRFDRVLQNAQDTKLYPVVEAFSAGEPVMVIGSSWPADLKVLLPFIQNHIQTLKFVIAPHEIHEAEINQLCQQFDQDCIRYTKTSLSAVGRARILVVDTIGMLASLYQYGTYAYIGGAFGKGLHNTLEAAVFGLPLFFGPKHTKFQEALDLIEKGCAFPVHTTADLEAAFSSVSTSTEVREQIKEHAIHYVRQQSGATQKVLNALQQWIQNKEQ